MSSTCPDCRGPTDRLPDGSFQHDIYMCHWRIAAENKLLNANLTATQARCTELLEEVRRLKLEAIANSDYRDWHYADQIDP